jgi:hypothetical protein
MEQRFSVEAKSFCFSAKEGFSNFHLEEKRKGFVGVILVGHQCFAWLVAAVEEVVQSLMKKEFVKSCREAEKALMVRRGGNKAGRFLEVSVYEEGGRKGIIWIPKG